MDYRLQPQWLPNPVAFSLFGKEIYWYGIFIACAFILGVLLTMRAAKRMGYNPDDMIDFCILLIPFAIIGARLYYVIFNWEYYSSHTSEIIKVWHGGLAIYGGVITGIIAAIIFAKWKKFKFWDIADIVAPSLILGQAIGRWGNFVNQEAFGYVVTNPKLQFFPFAVYIEELWTCTDPLCQCQMLDCHWHMATFFYESMLNLAIFGVLLYWLNKRKRRGEVFALYAILYSVIRFFIEGLRTDSLYLGNTSIRVSQLVSILLIIAGVGLFVYHRKAFPPIDEEKDDVTEHDSDKTTDETFIADSQEETK